jgi:hypothetical protein
MSRRPSAFNWPGFGERPLTKARLAKMDPWEQASALANEPEAEREAHGWRMLKREDEGLADEVMPGDPSWDDGPPGNWGSFAGDDNE